MAEAVWWFDDPDDPHRVTTRLSGVFEGGGAKGVAYAGALEVVANHGCWFSAVAGSSAGSITAALIAAGLKPEAFRALIPDGLKTLTGGWPRWMRAARGTSPYDAVHLRTWLEGILQGQVRSDRTNPDPVTFKELYETERGGTGIELNIVAVDLAQQSPIVFSTYDTPECGVVQAVVASSAMPVAFKIPAFNAPSFDRPHLVCDGGVWANFPRFVFTDKSFRERPGRHRDPDPVVGFVLDEPGKSQSGEADWTGLKWHPDKETSVKQRRGLWTSYRLSFSPLPYPSIRKWWLKFIFQPALHLMTGRRYWMIAWTVWPLFVAALAGFGAFSLVSDKGHDLPSWGYAVVSVVLGMVLIGGYIYVVSLLGFMLSPVLGWNAYRGAWPVMKALVATPGVPHWYGKAKGDHVIRLPIDEKIVWTTRFDIKEPELGKVIAQACEATRDQLPAILSDIRKESELMEQIKETLGRLTHSPI